MTVVKLPRELKEKLEELLLPYISQHFYGELRIIFANSKIHKAKKVIDYIFDK